MRELRFAHGGEERSRGEIAVNSTEEEISQRRGRGREKRRWEVEREAREMANNSYEKQESNGLGWANQSGNNFDEDFTNAAATKGAGRKGIISTEKLVEVNKKVKAVASSGMEKTKEVVTLGAHKVKTGTSSGLLWIKEKVQRKK